MLRVLNLHLNQNSIISSSFPFNPLHIHSSMHKMNIDSLIEIKSISDKEEDIGNFSKINRNISDYGA